MKGTRTNASCDGIKLDLLLFGDESSAEFHESVQHVETCRIDLRDETSPPEGPQTTIESDRAVFVTGVDWPCARTEHRHGVAASDEDICESVRHPTDADLAFTGEVVRHHRDP